MFDIFNYFTLRDKFVILAKIECLLCDMIRISFWKDYSFLKGIGDKTGGTRLG